MTQALQMNAKRLRIALLVCRFDNAAGGAERYVVTLARALAQTDEVHVFSQEFGPPVAGVTYHRIAWPIRRPRWLNYLFFAWMTWRATRTGFDIVHSHENSWHGDVHTVHVVPVTHSLFANRRGWRWCLRWMKVLSSPRLLCYLALERSRYRVDKQCVVVSPWLGAALQSSFPHLSNPLVQITPVCVFEPRRVQESDKQLARQTLGLPLQSKCLLFVGNDMRKKGLPQVLQALKLLPATVVLAVAGASKQIEAMRKLCAAQGLNDRVFFLGAVDAMEVAYAAADCLVHPTLEDTYAMVVLEAMAFALPVVVSGPAYCGISSELRDGVDALLLQDPLDVGALHRAVLRLLNDAQLCADLAHHALRFASARDVSTLAVQHRSLYLEQIKRRGTL